MRCSVESYMLFISLKTVYTWSVCNV